MNDGGAVLLGIPVIVIILVWLGMAALASAVAPADRRGIFFVLTLFLGPVGVIAAAVAGSRGTSKVSAQPPAPGRVRVTCPRCGAPSDLPVGSTTFECWRCPERGEIPKAVPPPAVPVAPVPFLRDVLMGDIDDVPRKFREWRTTRGW
jgi:hypothetical protein